MWGRRLVNALELGRMIYIWGDVPVEKGRKEGVEEVDNVHRCVTREPVL